jgi:hypothetical protein
VVLQTVVTLINLGGQRLGLTEATSKGRDPEQTRVAIEAVRALLPLIEADASSADQLSPVRDALSQLQLAYAREAGATEQQATEPSGQGPEPQQEAPPQQPTRRGSSGRLWVPPGSQK